MSGQQDLFRARLDQIIDMNNPWVRLAHRIDWDDVRERFGLSIGEKGGHPPLDARLMIGLLIIKYTDNLSDEILCKRWLENPYYQYFCGIEFFQHTLPFDRSSLSRWRKRLNASDLEALLQLSLRTAYDTGALKPQQVCNVIVDTTVQEKAVSFPTDAGLFYKARAQLHRVVRALNIPYRQSFVRKMRQYLIRFHRYRHAKQYKRARKMLRKIKGQLYQFKQSVLKNWRVCDLDKKPLCQQLTTLLERIEKILTQGRGGKDRLYSIHAPEVECIGKGKAHKPYEFGVKVSIATVEQPAGAGCFVLDARALPDNPYDGHTLYTVLTAIERITGVRLQRVLVDRGYKGHNAPPHLKNKVFRPGLKRGVTKAIRQALKRRNAIEPVIGHLKHEHRMGRCYLKGTHGDAINAVLAAVGYNFALLLTWLRLLCAWIRWRFTALFHNIFPRLFGQFGYVQKV